MKSRSAAFRRMLVWVAIAMPLAALTGCGGSDRANVTGKLVRADGSPLVGGRVIATSEQTGKAAYGTTDQQGEFTLGVAEEGDGIPPGDYQVIVIEDLGDPDNPRRPAISKKYQRVETSGLNLSVQPGERTELNVTLDPAQR